MGYKMISRPQDLKGKSKKDAFKSEGYHLVIIQAEMPIKAVQDFIIFFMIRFEFLKIYD